MNSSLSKCLSEKKVTLIVSLPENNLKLALAALSEGADAVKMHVNVKHRASGNEFNAAESYIDVFRHIRSKYTGPLGIVPGGSYEEIKQSEMNLLSQIGFDYFSIYAHHMPSWMLKLSNMEKTFAISSDYDIEKMGQLRSLDITALEASIVPGEEYGSPLTFKDILAYKFLAEKVDVPVLIPSQRKLVPDDISLLSQAGVKGIMLGAVVTAHTADSIKSSVADFRNAIDKI
ncbi:hypothetical protein [Cytobacillus firmus]|uniref:hypothetical protein n=1 Tax=Cytobacillus firmus TaxID=1399 RepID=UPI0024C0F57F|nr:hypothetical protein [Cytobacillus firmus]WHY61484.1 hypothetical protein QNH42_23430 [Cytobacillus firmus]